MSEELLFTFPVINLLSSTSRSIKGEAAELLVTLEKVLVELSKAPKAGLAKEGGFPPISTLGSIAYRLLRCLWFQVQYYSDYYVKSGEFFVCLILFAIVSIGIWFVFFICCSHP